MGVDRALPDATRDPAVPRTRRRPLRPPRGHHLRHPGDVGTFRRTERSVDDRHRRRQRHRALGDHGDRRVVDGPTARDRRPRHVRGRDPAHRAMAHGGSRFHRQAGRRDRNRVVRGAGDPADRAAGGPADGVPTDTRIRDPGPEPPAGRRRTRRDQGRLPDPASVAARVARRLDPAAARGIGTPDRPRGPDQGVRGTVGCGRTRLPDHVRRRHDRPRSERDVRGVRTVQDSRDRHRSGHGRSTVPQGVSAGRQARLHRHRLLRDLQPRQRRTRRPTVRPDRGDRSGGHPHRDRHPRTRRAGLRDRIRRPDRRPG